MVDNIDSPAADNPMVYKPTAGKPAADKPTAGKPAADKPAADKPAAGKPAADKPAAGKPAADKPAAGKPAAGKPAAGKPAAGKPAAIPIPSPAEFHEHPDGYTSLAIHFSTHELAMSQSGSVEPGLTGLLPAPAVPAPAVPAPAVPAPAVPAPFPSILGYMLHTPAHTPPNQSTTQPT